MIALLLSVSVLVSLDDTAFAELLRNRLEAAPSPEHIVIGEERVLASRTLPPFYSERFYRPVWVRDGEVTGAAIELLRVLREVAVDGLDPADYHVSLIEAGLMRARAPSGGPRDLVDLELLLTDAFLLYGTHLLEGSVDPVRLDPEWHVAPSRRRDLMVLLANVTLSGRLTSALGELRPDAREYGRLKDALVDYRDIAREGGWPAVPDGPKLETGMRDERVRAVRARLRVSGEWGGRAREPELFDEELAEAVRRFQRRHGLLDDGVVGARTLEAMNVSAPERVRQIELSLERWRWLPDALGDRHIRVNIPSFYLELYEGGRPILGMRVVVGQPYRRTPVFSAKMTYLVLNPYWHVPPSIAVQDVLPAVRRDPTYLAAKNMRVFDGWGADTREIDSASVDWSSVSGRSFPYRFRQEPGPLNALGRVKFMFPNPHNVYLHDTPSRELFARADRSFSSGCIRLEKPLELASLLLGPEWSEQRLREEVGRVRDRTVLLPEPVDVHLLYLTSWVGEEGAVHFRRDLYGRDVLLDEALRARPPRWNLEGE